MKRTVLVCLALLMAALLTLKAEEKQTSDGLYWELNGTTLTISGNGPMRDYPPEELGGMKLYNVVETVIIKDGVTSIIDGAFKSCETIKSINIPSSVTSIGMVAFIFNKNLTTINIPNSVTSIGSSAFYGCNKLTTILSLPIWVIEGGEAEWDRIGLPKEAVSKYVSENKRDGSLTSSKNYDSVNSSDLAVFDLKGKVKSCTLQTPERTSSYLASMIDDEVIRFNAAGVLQTSKQVKRDENGKLSKYGEKNILYDSNGRVSSLYETTFVILMIMDETWKLTYSNNRVYNQSWRLDEDAAVITTFNYTKIDKNGNWTERVATCGDTKRTERRTITYY